MIAKSEKTLIFAARQQQFCKIEFLALAARGL